MQHARPDYQRFQDPLGLIPNQEPVLLLRAQDALAAQAAEYYAKLCEDVQAEEVGSRIREHAKKMRDWPVKKIPDIPESFPPISESEKHALALLRTIAYLQLHSEDESLSSDTRQHLAEARDSLQRAASDPKFSSITAMRP
jgi:hypothetical protein